MTVPTKLGVGYRPELALAIERRSDLQFVEILAEDYRHPREIPQALKRLHQRGVEVLVHSVSLSLGQAPAASLSAAARSAASNIKDSASVSVILRESVISGFKLIRSAVGDNSQAERNRIRTLRSRLKHLDEMARYFDSPFVSDHIAFVRAGELESGHLLPVERSEAMLAILKENIGMAKEALSVPLVLENIACTFDQPGAQMDEATFVARLLEQTDCGLLLDLSNLFANAHNLCFSAEDYLRRLPLERLKYVHLAGGAFKRGLYHDTHCHPLKRQSLKLLEALLELTEVPRVMLERDDCFPPAEEFNDELNAISFVLAENLGLSPPIELANAAAPAQIVHASDENRRMIGEAQKALIRALLGMTAPPPGFDSGRIEEVVQSLRRKRLRAMRRAHPCLAAAADEDIVRYFDAFPSIPSKGPFADGAAFFKWQRHSKQVMAHPADRHRAAEHDTNSGIKI